MVRLVEGIGYVYAQVNELNSTAECLENRCWVFRWLGGVGRSQVFSRGLAEMRYD